MANNSKTTFAVNLLQYSSAKTDWICMLWLTLLVHSVTSLISIEHSTLTWLFERIFDYFVMFEENNDFAASLLGKFPCFFRPKCCHDNRIFRENDDDCLEILR